MKLFLSLALLLASTLAHAGSNSCTNSSNLSWTQAQALQGPFSLSTSDCVVNATQADAGSTTQNVALSENLPLNPSDGDQFTLVDQSDFSVDVCSTWYDDPSWGGDGNTYSGCQPGGIGFNTQDSSLVGDALDGYAQGITLTEFYFVSCDVGDVTPGSNPCTSATLPSYWSEYPKVRYKFQVTFNASTGYWDDVATPLQ